MNHALLSFLLLVLFAGCGEHHKSSAKKIVPIVPEEMEDVLNNQDIRCESISGEPCPEGIARLFIIDPVNPETSAVCTGFLIDDKTLITNNHCVSTTENCRNTFISISSHGTTISTKCAEIILTESSSTVASVERKNDITIMKIEGNYPGAYFSVAKTRISSDRRVSVWTMDHFDLYRANITELNCDYVQKPGAMELHECPTIAGNSGSPIVLRGSTTVFGVIWGSTVPPEIDATYPLQDRRNFPAISLGTELFPFYFELNGEDSSPR